MLLTKSIEEEISGIARSLSRELGLPEVSEVAVSNSVQTISVVGKTIVVNPSFWEKVKRAGAERFIVFHELKHIANEDDMKSTRFRYPELYNVISDALINKEAEAMGILTREVAEKMKQEGIEPTTVKTVVQAVNNLLGYNAISESLFENNTAENIYNTIVSMIQDRRFFTLKHSY